MDMPDPPLVAELCSIEAEHIDCPESPQSCFLLSMIFAGSAFRGGGGGAKEVGEDLVETFAVSFGLSSVAPLHDPVVTLYYFSNRD
jgi:hypothetical protein